MKTAQAEINSIISERKVLAELTKSVPSPVDRNYKPNNEDLIYAEQSHQWKKPYIVLH